MHASAAAPPNRLPPAVAAVVALALGLAAIAATPGYAPRNDAEDYERHALSIARGDGYPPSRIVPGEPSAFRPPLYPYFLGGIYKATGNSRLAGRIANALLGAIAVLLLYLLTLRVAGPRLAAWAAGLAAVFPPLVFLSLALMSEALFIALLLGTVLALLAYRDSDGSLPTALLTGLLAGLLTLTRANGIAIALLAVVVVLAGPQAPRRRLIAATVTLLGCVVVLAPWTIRNADELGGFVPVSTQAGFAAGTYNEQARTSPVHPGGFHPLRAVPEFAEILERPGLTEAELDAELRERALEHALDHPGYVLRTTWLNALRVSEVLPLRGDFSTPHLVERGLGTGAKADLARISALVAAALAILGIVVLLRAPRDAPGLPRAPWFFWLVPVILLVVTLPIDGRPRYRAPVDPFIVLLASVAIVWAGDRLRTWRERG